MALIKCPECGKEISDKAEACPNCGCPIEKMEKTLIENDEDRTSESKDVMEFSENDKVPTKEERKMFSKKQKGILLIGCGVIVIALLVFLLTGNVRTYSTGKKLIQERKYGEAVQKFDKIKSYKDSEKLYTKSIYEYAKQLMQEEKFEDASKYLSKIIEYKDSEKLKIESQHLYDIQHDSEAPILSGIENGETIEIDYMEIFNLNTYLADKVKIVDNVTKDIKDYEIIADSAIYDKISGNVNSSNPGDYNINIQAIDEAGNVGKINFTLKVKDIVYVTLENPNPIIYDGEYGKVTLESCQHGYLDGLQQYRITFQIENKSGNTLSVWLYDAYLNDNRVQAYTNGSQIASGKNGTSYSLIQDDDITKELKDFELMETNFLMGYSIFDSISDLSRQIYISRDVFQEQ